MVARRRLFMKFRMLLIAPLVCFVLGCYEEEKPTDLKPRETPKFDSPTTGTAPAARATVPEPTPPASTQLPPGHPPIGGAGQPAAPAGGGPESDEKLEVNPPAEWVAKPARMMTMMIFEAPRAEGDPEDADVAI